LGGIVHAENRTRLETQIRPIRPKLQHDVTTHTMSPANTGDNHFHADA
jgi:hypothetical protein